MKIFLLLHVLAFPLLLFSQQEYDIAKLAYRTIHLPGSPDFMATDGDGIWILNIDRVEKLGANSSNPVLTAAVPGGCGALICDLGSLWVASCTKQSIYRLDKKTGKIIAIIPCGIADHQGEIMLATGAGSLWVMSDSAGILTRINAASNAIEAKIPVLAGSYCATFGFGALWIANTDSSSVQRVDPLTNLVTATIRVGKTPRFLAAGEGAIWTLNQGDGTVSRINPIDNKLAAVIDTKVPGGGGDIAVGAGRVWVRATSSRLLQTIDPSSNKIESIYTPVAGSGAVRVSENFVWVSAHDINTVWVLKQ